MKAPTQSRTLSAERRLSISAELGGKEALARAELLLSTNEAYSNWETTEEKTEGPETEDVC